MSTVELVFGILLLIFSVLIVTVVLFQEGSQSESGGIITGGGTDTFLMKNKSRSIDSFLERWTRFIAIGFFISVILINMIAFFKLLGA